MEFPILAVLLVSFILSVDSHPKNSDVLPKDYYKRQILQPIPGYIPVYIKADGVPIVRTQTKKHSPSVTSEKLNVPKEKHLQPEEVNTAKNEDNKSDETKNESSTVEESKKESKTPVNLEVKSEPVVDSAINEKPVENPHVKDVDLKP